MDKKGFTLIEMAIVLVIFGLILASATSVLTLFVNKGGAERTRKMIESDKNALYSYGTNNNQLPVSASFGTSVTYPNDGYNKSFYYYADPILDKTMSGWNLSTMSTVNAICGAYYTNTSVKICNNAACSSSSTVSNVAFVIASGSENKNIQTAASSGVVTVYAQGTDAKDDYAGDMTRTEKYDDIVDWVTLDELRTRAGCAADRFSYLNTTMPAVLEGELYSFNFYVNGGIPFAYGTSYQPEYKWMVTDVDNIGSYLSTNVTTTPIFIVRHSDGTQAGTISASTDKVQGAYLQMTGNSTSLPTSQFRITVTVIDKASEINTSNPKTYIKTFVVNTQ